MKQLSFFLAAAILILGSTAQAQVVTTIYDLQQDNYLPGTLVTVEGVIVTGLDLISGGRGFFAQEQGGGPHSALYVYVGPLDPNPPVAVGDIVDITGPYEDYFGLAELDLSASGSFTIVGNGPPPVPELLRAADIQTYVPVLAHTAGVLNTAAEQWESVLVRVENIRAISLNEGFGSWYAEEFGYATNDTLLCGPDLGVAGPPVSTEMSSVTGVIWYHHDYYRIVPRTQIDVIFSGLAPAPNLQYACVTGDASLDVRFDRPVEETTAENPFNYFMDVGSVSAAARDAVDDQLVHLTLSSPSVPETQQELTVINVQNVDGVPMVPQATRFWGGVNTIAFSQLPGASGDSSAVAGQVITVKGVIHSEYDVWGNHVYLQEVNGPNPRSPYNGLEVYMPALLPTVAEGDIVIIGDVQTEYFNMTSLVAPFYYFEKVSSGNPVLPPEVITIGDMSDVTTYETYEGALVEVANALVVQSAADWNFYNWAVTQDGTNWLLVGDMGTNDYTGDIGDRVNIRGTLRYEFGEYVLMPRDDEDIDILYQEPSGASDLPAGVQIALAQNHPNPFNPSTKISFVLAAPGEARLEIFDTAGRLVQTLVAAQLGAGSHELTWRGDTAAGTQASSGLYYYRLTANGASETRKMLMLK